MSSSSASNIHEMVFGFMAAKIVYAAAELGIADQLSEEPRTSAELADRTEAHGPSLRRLLRGLSGLGIVAQTGADRFELTELGEPLRADAPDSAQALVTMLCGPEDWRSWGELVPSVRSGESGWVRAHGTSWIDFYWRNPEQSATFNRAMAEHTRDAAPGILACADLSRFQTVADVGGGDGTLIAEALRAEPDLDGILFDLPSGLDAAPATLETAGVAERCRLVCGDFFQSVPEGAGAYLLKQVLHDWDDEEAVAILQSVRRAMPPEGRLLVVERMLPEVAGPEDAQTLLVDVLMLVVTGGRERTEREFRGLMDAAGFELSRLTAPIPPFDYRVIEGAPVPM
jgi:O-methyltransferase domain/Dimerisation domain